jgi:hypothetical protein
MANQEWSYGEARIDPPATGPDYVALVIEWDDMEDCVTEVVDRPELSARAAVLKRVAIGAAALGALLLARWGIHRLRV